MSSHLVLGRLPLHRSCIGLKFNVSFLIQLLSILIKCPIQRSLVVLTNELSAIIPDFLLTSALLTFIVQLIRI